MSTKQLEVVEHPAKRPIVLAVFTNTVTKKLGRITKIGNVLLGREKDNVWRLPGGRLQPRERKLFVESTTEIDRNRIIRKALRRELGEEVSVDLLQDIHFFKKEKGEGLSSGDPLTAYVYIVHPDGDVSLPSNSSEFIELKWVSQTDLSKLLKKGGRVSPIVKKVLTSLRNKGVQ